MLVSFHEKRGCRRCCKILLSVRKTVSVVIVQSNSFLFFWQRNFLKREKLRKKGKEAGSVELPDSQRTGFQPFPFLQNTKFLLKVLEAWMGSFSSFDERCSIRVRYIVASLVRLTA